MHSVIFTRIIIGVQNDPKVPVKIREKFSSFGLCKDEFEDYGHVPPQLYIRISNRLVGSYVMTQNNMPPISSGEHPDGIAIGEHETSSFLIDWRDDTA